MTRVKEMNAMTITGYLTLIQRGAAHAYGATHTTAKDAATGRA